MSNPTFSQIYDEDTGTTYDIKSITDATLSEIGTPADAKTVGEYVRDIDSNMSQIATFPTETLVNTKITSTSGTIPTNIDGLSAGDIVEVSVNPDNLSGVVYNVLTTASIGGSTIRVINMSSENKNTVTITLEGNERVLVVRCANTSGETRNFAVKAVKINDGDVALKESVVIPTDSTLSISGKPADALATKNAIHDTVTPIEENLSQIAFFPTIELIKEQRLTASASGTQRVVVSGRTAGDTIRVTVNSSVSLNTAYDVLLSNSEGGATLRKIDMSASGLNTVDIVLVGTEAVLTIRCISYDSVEKIFDVYVYEVSGGSTRIRESVIPDNYWIDKTKKIVWFGTSIPAGNYGNLSYPIVLGEKLGITLYNEAVGSSRARASWLEFISTSNPLGMGNAYNSTIKAMGYSLEEKQYLIDNYATIKDSFTDAHPETLSASDILAIKNYSFERKLYRYLSAKESVYNTVDTNGFIGDVDLYVFDHGYNDVTGRYNSDTTIPDFGAENEMYYFAGAINRYIKEIMENNPYAKIILISHYANTVGKKDATAVEMQNRIADFWKIPIINVYKEMGWTDIEITVDGVTKTVRQTWLPDGIHPASDSTGKAVERYVKILYPYFRDFLNK